MRRAPSVRHWSRPGGSRFAEVVARVSTAGSGVGSATEIRRLTAADLPRVLEIEAASFSTPWSDATFRGLLGRADCDLFAAERDGRLIGYAVCWTAADESELGNVAVAPDARGSGAGESLVRAVQQVVRARGSRECYLEVRQGNRVAISLYERHGWRVVGRRPRYYRKPTEDALVLCWSVPTTV